MMSKIKVLIVDDEEELASLLVERLNFRDFDTDFAITSADAIKSVENKLYDIAIIDVRLKGINGIELMKLIMQIQLQIKVILFTGYGTEEEGRRGLALGASKYIVKPINLENLILEILDVLEKKN